LWQYNTEKIIGKNVKFKISYLIYDIMITFIFVKIYFDLNLFIFSKLFEEKREVPISVFKNIKKWAKIPMFWWPFHNIDEILAI